MTQVVLEVDNLKINVNLDKNLNVTGLGFEKKVDRDLFYDLYFHYKNIEIKDYESDFLIVPSNENNLTKFQECFIIFIRHKDIISSLKCSDAAQKIISNIPGLENVMIPNPERKVRFDTIKSGLNQLFNDYRTQGNKFFFFSQSPQRQQIMQELSEDINKLFIARAETSQVYNQMAKKIVEAYVKTVADHQQNSFAGSIGLTQSRLAAKLDNYLQTLITAGSVQKETIDQYKRAAFQELAPITASP